MNEIQRMITALSAGEPLQHEDWLRLIADASEDDRRFSRDLACKRAQARFGRRVFFRGIIEFTNYCKNDCYYCGIRCSNRCLSRYRLTEDEILSCCEEGYRLGYRTFVLQGGEDGWWTDEKITALVRRIRAQYPDCAITLSIGEKSCEVYQAFFDAGADRYLLRHETANEAHYAKLHPARQTLSNRIRCLRDLKDIGYQTGAGMMIGAPYQTAETLAQDILLAGFEIVEQGVQSGADVPQAAAALASKVDCINNFTDNNVVDNLTSVLAKANEAGIPVYGSEVEQVRKGCIASESLDYIALGKETGTLAAKVLNGADPRTTAVVQVKDSTPVVNTDVLEVRGITLPDAYTAVEKVTTSAD